MKQIKCDRCGKVEAAEPMMKGYDFPIIKITRQDGIFDTIHPREVDLCKDCRRQLAEWLKPSAAMKDILKYDMKVAENLRNRCSGMMKNLADDGCALGPKPQRPRPKMSVEKWDGPEKDMLLALLLMIFGGHGHGDPT